MQSEQEQEEDLGLGLEDLLPEPESPLPAPFSFATYEPPDPTGADLELELLEPGRIVTRLVGSHPLWGHHLCVPPSPFLGSSHLCLSNCATSPNGGMPESLKESWNTARTLSTYLLHNPRLWKGRTVAELGAGAGLPSIVCAAGGGERVVVTDYPDNSLVSNLEYNLDVNLPGPSRRRSAAMGHVWGADPLPLLSQLPDNRPRGFDLLLLSDLVFNHSQHPALVKSVNALLRPASSSDNDEQPCILVFFTHHRPRLASADMAFFPLLAPSGEGWAYEKVVEDWTGPMFDDDPGDAQVRGTVHGWRAWRVGPGEQGGERPSRMLSAPSPFV